MASGDVVTPEQILQTVTDAITTDAAVIAAGAAPLLQPRGETPKRATMRHVTYLVTAARVPRFGHMGGVRQGFMFDVWCDRAGASAGSVASPEVAVARLRAAVEGALTQAALEAALPSGVTGVEVVAELVTGWHDLTEQDEQGTSRLSADFEIGFHRAA